MAKRSLWVFVAALVSSVGCDQAAKQVAGQLLGGSSGLVLAGGVVQLQVVQNPGAFLSLGAGLPEVLRQLLLIGLVPLALGLVSWLAWRPGHSRSQLAALGLVAGGGLANWLDRLLHGGAVTDFVSVGLGPLRSGIFHLADVAIVAGLLLLLRASAAFRAESGAG